jgi:hypothetical protein
MMPSQHHKGPVHTLKGIRPRGTVQKRVRERIDKELPDSLLDDGCRSSHEDRAGPEFWQANLIAVQLPSRNRKEINPIAKRRGTELGNTC